MSVHRGRIPMADRRNSSAKFGLVNQQVCRGDLLECGLKGSPKVQASIGDDSQKLHPQARCTTLRLNLPQSPAASLAPGKVLRCCNSGFLGLLLFLSLWALGTPSLPARRGCFNSEETPSQQEGFLSRLWSHWQVESMASLSL